MKNLIRKLYHNSVLRYVFFGGLTTFVNFAAFYLLHDVCNIELNLSNIISVALSILFAYFVNSRFVFQSSAVTFRERFVEFCKFVGARLFTMLIEVSGVYLLADVLELSALLSKLSTQILVLILNYLISRLIVFIRRKP